MKTIFIICGTTGSYSDRCDWNVRAFRSREKAEAYMAVLSAKNNEIESALRDDDYGHTAEEAKKDEMKMLDPNGIFYWGEGVDYSIQELAFDGAKE